MSIGRPRSGQGPGGGKFAADCGTLSGRCRELNEAGANSRARRPKPPGPLPIGRQLVWIEVSSITKLVCSEESSVPVNFRVTLLPA